VLSVAKVSLALPTGQDAERLGDHVSSEVGQAPALSRWRGGRARLRDEENKLALSRSALSRRSHRLRLVLVFPVQLSLRDIEELLKTEAQQVVLALRRMCQQLVKFWTMQINCLRGLLTEYGEVGAASAHNSSPHALFTKIRQRMAVVAPR
jgi:hypothetical protein